jgi:2',3'-cyclic-nucleotide 2'-phosphodiesterase/3'-nucleotidase
VLNEEIEQINEQSKIDTNREFSAEVGFNERTVTKQRLSQPYGTSELGNWICDSMKEKTGADAALFNIRYLNNDVLRGKVLTYTFHYVTYKSKVATITINKSELKSILEDAFKDADVEKKIGRGPGVEVAGIRIKYDMSRPNLDRIVDITREDGSEIDDGESLKVAVNNLIYQARVGFPELKQHDSQLTDIPVWKCLEENFRRNGAIITDTASRLENVGQLIDKAADVEQDEDELDDAA